MFLYKYLNTVKPPYSEQRLRLTHFKRGKLPMTVLAIQRI